MTKTLEEQIGSRIRTLRENAGITQGELGEAVGSHNNHISRIERGIVSNVGLSLLERIAKKLGISLSRLLNFPEDKETIRAEIDTMLDQCSEKDLLLVHRVLDTLRS